MCTRTGSRLSWVEADDRRRILEATAGPIDLVVDLLPREASASQVHANILAVRHGGRIVLMGGVRSELALNYNWLMHREVTLSGAWMYRGEAVAQVVRLVRAGLVDLGQFGWPSSRWIRPTRPWPCRSQRRPTPAHSSAP